MISRMRPSSVVPGAAVNPNRALVSTTMPVEVAAFFFAFSFTRGCQRLRPSPESGRKVRAWFFDLVLDVAFDRALGDAHEVGNGLGPSNCLTKNRICAPADFGIGRVAVLAAALSRLSPRMPIRCPYSPLTSVTPLRSALGCGAARCRVRPDTRAAVGR